MNSFIVYSHQNRTNEKRYIGWAVVGVSQDIYEAMFRRWKDHCYDAELGSTRVFHNAIRKYGTSDLAWKHEILDVMTSQEDAKRAEKLWISHLRTNHMRKHQDHVGYNMTDGGDGVVGYVPTPEVRLKMSLAHKGYQKTPEHLENLRIANTGKKRSPETCARIGASKTGDKHPFWGKKLPQQTRQRMSDGQKHKRAVNQFTKQGKLIATHASLCDAERATGVYATNIVKACQGKLKTSGKFMWKYAEETKEMV